MYVKTNDVVDIYIDPNDSEHGIWALFASANDTNEGMLFYGINPEISKIIYRGKKFKKGVDRAYNEWYIVIVS